MIAFDHINIHAHDLEAARDFLVTVLGLETGFRPPFDFPGYWLYLDGQPLIHMQHPRAGAEAGRGWVDHLAFGLFDFAAEKQRLEALGLRYAESGIPGTGIRQLFVYGPENLKIELQCREA